MIRFTGMLTGILITIGLYLLYLNINMQAAPVPVDIVPDQTMKAALPSPVHPPKSPSRISDQENEAGATSPMVINQQASTDTSELEAGTDSGAQEAAFWKPFHSRYSATGFARRMTVATGIQIHVLPADKHQYRVAFNYLDEDDRATKISIIESITGLELTP